jgi:hypothetical protein
VAVRAVAALSNLPLTEPWNRGPGPHMAA